jgi:hypothetical protein
MSELGQKAEVAPVERHVRSFLNNGPEDHSLAPIGRLVVFDPRSGSSFLKKLKIWRSYWKPKIFPWWAHQGSNLGPAD